MSRPPARREALTCAAHPRPFVWTATADSIRAKLQHLGKRINGAQYWSTKGTDSRWALGVAFFAELFGTQWRSNAVHGVTRGARSGYGA